MKAFRISSLIEEKATKEGRKRADVRAELRLAVGVNRVRMSQIENAERRQAINGEHLSKMAEYFCCPIDELFNTIQV